jgi:hypothetical protein
MSSTLGCTPKVAPSVCEIADLGRPFRERAQMYVQTTLLLTF